MYHLRPLQMWFNAMGGPQSIGETTLGHNHQCRSALRHWANSSFLQKTSFIDFPRQLEVTLTTDASDKGWGAHLGRHSASGIWPPEVQSWHINAKEMKAVHLAIRALAHHLVSKLIHLRTDNTTVMYQINKGGGTKSVRLLDVLGDIYRAVHRLNSVITASHIPGRQNIQADLLSRMTTNASEWTLHPRLFQILCKRWGHPSIDLFASHTNHQMRPYVTIEQDAFSLRWQDQRLIYAFPPFALIQRFLVQLRSLPSYQVILVAPLWRSRPWYTLLLELGPVDQISLAEEQQQVLFQQIGDQMMWADTNRYQLVAWRLSKC